jgi:hypothetical protein
MSWTVAVCIDLTCVMAARERQRDEHLGIAIRRLSWPTVVPAAARRAAAEHQDEHGQPITRDALRARHGVSNQAASELLRQLRSGEGRPPGTSRAA